MNVMLRAMTLYLLFILVFLETSLFAITQITSFPIDDWVKKLSAEKDIKNENFRAVSHQLYQIYQGDRKTLHLVLTELEKRLASENLFYRARVHCLKAITKARSDYPDGRAEVKKLFDAALKEAYQTGDTNLISLMSWWYGMEMYGYNELELGATHCLKAVELNFLNQSGGYAYSARLGEILFHCREYEKSIFYSRWSIANWPDTDTTKDKFFVQIWNTIGQAYQKLGLPDSALVNYERSMLFANKLNEAVWKAINSGFMGQVFFLKKDYETAKPLLTYDYSINKARDLNIAAYSLQWLARINLIQGKKDSALWQAKESLRLLEVSDPKHLLKVNYRQYTYHTLADVYNSMGKTDSFYRYFQLYINLHDSLERVIARSSADMSRMRNENEKKIYEVQVLQREKRLERQQRNLIIAAILFLAFVAVLLINRQRLKSKHKEELAIQEQLRAGQEIEAARSQLKMFTQNIIEKTNLVEQLEREIHDKALSTENQQVLTELSQRTILTEEDWDKFRSLFEKIFPLFFQRLKTRAADISLAEQRMAALTRLQLTNRQMASMLGISVESVQKARQRLRKRFNLGHDVNPEEYFAAI